MQIISCKSLLILLPCFEIGLYWKKWGKILIGYSIIIRCVSSLSFELFEDEYEGHQPATSDVKWEGCTALHSAVSDFKRRKMPFGTWKEEVANAVNAIRAIDPGFEWFHFNLNIVR